MREANNIIPFPTEILNFQKSNLESYIIDLTENKLPFLNELSNTTFYTKQIETYANWMSDLTEKDSKHWERGVVIHVQTDNKKLIFPKNPDIGEDACGWAVSKRRDLFLPTINIHTHPQINICFSPGDMSTFLSGWGDKTTDFFIPTGMLVSAPKFNFLILKSQETPSAIDKNEVYNKSWIKYGGEEYFKLAEDGVKKVGSFQPIDDAFNGFFNFYKAFVSTFKLAQEYKFGFYYSTKDGIYTPFTKDKLTEVMTSILDDTISRL